MVKNLVFYAILLYASVRDHKTHTVPDSVHVLILLEYRIKIGRAHV